MSDNELISAFEQSYVGVEEDKAYTSTISNFQIASATNAKFDYSMPQDGVNGAVYVWEGLIVDTSKTPLYKGSLRSSSGTYEINAGDINFNQGVYTVAITADSNTNTVAATQSLVAGQVAQAGSSSIFVTNKQLNRINAVFNSPANVNAKDNITWFTVRTGTSLGQGTRVANQPSAPGASSGVVIIPFPPGTLKNGEMYNLAMNPGYTTSPISAGYVFKYVVQ